MQELHDVLLDLGDRPPCLGGGSAIQARPDLRQADEEDTMMNQISQLADLYEEALHQRMSLATRVVIGAGAIAEDEVRFKIGPVDFHIPLYQDDEGYFPLMLFGFFTTDDSVACEDLERIGAEVTSKCRGAQLDIYDGEAVVTTSAVMFVAPPDCLPTVVDLKVVLSRAIQDLANAVNEFLVAATQTSHKQPYPGTVGHPDLGGPPGFHRSPGHHGALRRLRSDAPGVPHK
ncbi:hypothetical protein ACWGI8_10970 [Streptomyces sp. NPDC054841]